MTVAALLLALIALLVSIISAWFAHRATRAAESQAEIARAQDLRDRSPLLHFRLNEQAGPGEARAFYSVRNDGPEDLRSIVIYRPAPPDGIRYPIAVLGGDFGDTAELGPLEMGQTKEFVLAIGTAESLPEFRVRVVCRRGSARWESSELLTAPRFHAGVW